MLMDNKLQSLDYKQCLTPRQIYTFTDLQLKWYVLTIMRSQTCVINALSIFVYIAECGSQLSDWFCGMVLETVTRC